VHKMSRTKGSVDADYELKRAAILQRIKPRLLAGETRGISFSEFAALAEVSIPTLRHYFPTRSDVVAALLEFIGSEGKPYIGLLAETNFHEIKASLQEIGGIIQAGVRRGGTTSLHALGLTEGIGNATIGPSYLNSILEPTLQALETRLALHISRGEMQDCDVRFAALNFVAPLLIGFLHQDKLGGTVVRPMQMEMLLEEQITVFVKAYGTADAAGIHERKPYGADDGDDGNG